MARGLDSSQQRDPVLRAIHRQLREVAAKGERVMAAVSGGADSLALAAAIAEIAPSLGLELAVGSVDHGLRPGSDAEVERVRAWAASRGIPFASERVQVGREGGLEAAARKARYAALERLADRLGADWIATAHTASDQAETVLLRLGRGASARGASGVLPVRGRVLRPMLEVTRAQVEAFLRARGLAPLAEDPSNRDLARARNRVRHEVLPALRQALGPGVDRALARFAAAARDDEAALRARAATLSNDRDRLRRAPAAVLRRWLRRELEDHGYSPNARELDQAARAVRSKRAGELELGRRVRVRAEGNAVHVEPVRQAKPGAPVRIAPGTRSEVEWAQLEVELQPRAGPLASGALALPPDVALPLVIRPVQPGDRLAGERGTVRLKRLLIDRKVPRSERTRVAVLVDAQGTVLAALGQRVAAPLHAARARPDGWVLTVRPLERSRARARDHR